MYDETPGSASEGDADYQSIVRIGGEQVKDELGRWDKDSSRENARGQGIAPVC
jgi:hypothetical protein